jgi:hypothetical protein
MSVSVSRACRGIGAAAVAIGLGSGPAAASIYGPLDNFDVVNDTGQDVCGFEIEIEGVHKAEVYRTFETPYIRYLPPTLTDTPTGVVIRYQGEWDPATRTFLQKTPPAAPGYVPADDSCWTGGLGAAYESSGCEHFGVSQTTQATATRYRWLSCNPDGTSSPLPEIGLPTPVWVVTPPAVAGDPPVVRAEVEIPNPEGGLYGEPYWVKIYKTEIDRPAVLDDLLMENPDVELAETEIEWELMQARPGLGLVFNEAPLPAGAEAVIRRYEFYRYDVEWGRTHTYVDPNTGLPVPYVDPENGEVQECVVDGCNDPTPEELGDYVGRQVAGFNVPFYACSNGADDDGDGLVDFPDDPGCATAESDLENPQCSDGVDNDLDGGADWDGAGLGAPDAQCAGDPARNQEAGGACGYGLELAFLLPPLFLARRRRRP